MKFDTPRPLDDRRREFAKDKPFSPVELRVAADECEAIFNENVRRHGCGCDCRTCDDVYRQGRSKASMDATASATPWIWLGCALVGVVVFVLGVIDK